MDPHETVARLTCPLRSPGGFALADQAVDIVAALVVVSEAPFGLPLSSSGLREEKAIHPLVVLARGRPNDIVSGKVVHLNKRVHVQRNQRIEALPVCLGQGGAIVEPAPEDPGNLGVLCDQPRHNGGPRE